jgi:hypothetical protein
MPRRHTSQVRAQAIRLLVKTTLLRSAATSSPVMSRQRFYLQLRPATKLSS